MTALATRLLWDDNLKISNEFEKQDFSAYQSYDYSKGFERFYKNEAAGAYVDKNSMTVDWKASALIASIFFSQKINGVVVTPSEDIYFHLRDLFESEILNYPQLPPRFIFSQIDSRLNIVIDELKTEPVDKVKLEAEFHSLVEQWEDETSFHSSLGEIFTNDAYQRIMAMGRDALPFIFQDLRYNPRHWFYALEKIVGCDVAIGAKNYREARAAWLKWGFNNEYF
ncbi:MAG TPA: hypothetical protein VGI03_11195 [Verrucomicrobiae bacterium]|jgi:hypothetical protein